MTRPRRWLFSDAPYPGGAERYLELLLEAAGPDELGLVGIESDGLRPWLEALTADGVVVHRVPGGPLHARWLGWWEWLRRERPQLVHVNMPGPYDGLMATAPWLARRAGVDRVVVTEHLPGVGRVGKRYPWKRFLLGAIDRAIVVCHAHEDLMVRTFGYEASRVVAIPNGIADPAPVRPRGDRRAALPADLIHRERGPGLRIVQLGSVDERKGPDRVVRALASVRAAGIGASLWFVGDGPMRADVEALAHRLGLTGHVHLLGHRDDAPHLLAAADVVTLASRREGLPFSLIEACAWARPIVALDTDGVGEIVIDGVNGRLVPVHRQDAFESALIEMATDTDRRHSRGDAARARFESYFTLDGMIARTFAQYGSEDG